MNFSKKEQFFYKNEFNKLLMIMQGMNLQKLNKIK